MNPFLVRNVASWLVLIVDIFASVCSASAQAPMAARIEHAGNEPQNWLTYYGSYGASSYSPMNQIARENVKQAHPSGLQDRPTDPPPLAAVLRLLFRGLSNLSAS